MLITFKSKAAADILMYEEHAKRVLDLLGKDVKRGIITFAETGPAIEKIEQEISAEQSRSKQESATVDAASAATDDEDEQPAVPTVSLATRVYPLLDMLRAAHKQNQSIMWGV